MMSRNVVWAGLFNSIYFLSSVSSKILLSVASLNTSQISFLHVLLSLSVYLCVCLMDVQKHVGTRSSCQVSSFAIHSLLHFLTPVLLLTIKLPNFDFAWLVNNLQGSFCVFLLSTGVTGLDLYTWLLHECWESKRRSSCFTRKHSPIENYLLALLSPQWVYWEMATEPKLLEQMRSRHLQ